MQQDPPRDWAEKYRPRHLQDIAGNATSIRQIAEWASKWTKNSKPLILYGKPGTGKTSAAHATATDMGWEILELNASDQRTAGVIERIAGTSSTTGSVTGASRKLIVLDEADNLHGTADRGGSRAILEIIRTSIQPIILIVNDLYGISPEIRSRCETVQFKALPARSIAPRLRFICSAEKRQCGDDAIIGIAEDAAGDMRAAITMLYAAAAGRTTVTAADVHTSRKDERSTIFHLVSVVYGGSARPDLLRLGQEIDEDPATILQWIEGNIRHLPDSASIDRAYRHLSRADLYLGATRRTQYYLLWRYASAMMLLGVASSAGGRGIHAKIAVPDRWQKMGSQKKQRLVRVQLLTKIAGISHMPHHTLRDHYLNAIALLVASHPEEYINEFRLDADELNLFLHDRARSLDLVRKAQAAGQPPEPEKKRQKTQGPHPSSAGRTGDFPLRQEPSKTTDMSREPDRPPAPEDHPESPARKKGSDTGQSTLF